MRSSLLALPAVGILLSSSCTDADMSSRPEAAQVLAACRSDSTSACCEDVDCENGAVCDFDFGCAQEPDHRVTCGAPTGTRECHASCAEGVACPEPGASCIETVQFEGSDVGHPVWMCF